MASKIFASPEAALEGLLFDGMTVVSVDPAAITATVFQRVGVGQGVSIVIERV